jgi:hypothetical protein
MGRRTATLTVPGASTRSGTVKLPMIEDAVKAGGFLAVQLEDIIGQLKAVEKRYPGLDRVICAISLDVQLEDLDRFAKEMMPALRQDRHRGATLGRD